MKLLLPICLAFFSFSVAAQDAPRAYVLEAIQIMKDNSVNKGKLNWDEITRVAMDSVANKQTLAEAQKVVKQVIRQLGDSHSQFVPEEAVRAYYKTYQEQGLTRPMPKDSLIAGKFAYLSLPAIGNLKGDDWTAYVKAFYDKALKLADQHPEAWLIDVRENDGGMLVPMLKAVAPFLDAKTPIGSKDNSGQINYYQVRGHDVLFGSRVIGSLAVPTIRLPKKTIPVYILTSKSTASSGEFIAASFVGQKNAKLVGNYTQGLTSDNSDFRLSDGSIIILTTGTLIDRKGKTYSELGKGIAPDLQVSGKFLSDHILAIPATKKLKVQGRR